ncbi:helix-turn-helix transcriptional regulator [Microbacterium sp. NPDC057659]|uniref:helix-turn-helix transcriptional regulator n=1 Tax=Microbacterium sp. NPDC057659 TaxID=3346198 RepID=UPI003672C111
MTRTTGRTLALLSLLQVRRDWTGAELRERLEVSDRTLRRDIDDLRELGYGIEATRGRHGGYRLGPGASVPPLTLLDDESVAIAVGLRAAAASVVTGMEEAAGRALAKLEQSLSAAARARIIEVERAMVRLDPAEGGGVDLDVVTALAAAISARRRLRIDYTRHDGAEVRRIVEPHRIVHTDERWYLVARDVEREEWRTLRVDRIRRPFTLPEEFAERAVPDDAVRQFTARSITTAPYPFRARVRMQAPAAEVRRRFDATIATVTAEGDESCILEAGSRDPQEFALYLGMSRFRFEVLEGAEVRQAVAAMGERLRNAAS